MVGRVLRGVWEELVECVGKCVESHGGRRRWEAMDIFGRFREIGGRGYGAGGARAARGYGKVGEVGGFEQNSIFFSPLAAI